jgi:diguanylate cyclase (GGDEF)-like protein
MNAVTDDIQAALDQLKGLIVGRVRAEQLRDQLTGLPNLAALQETIRTRLAPKAPPFWIAFVEVDRFKTINDRFGYANADALLKRIADQLDLARSWFLGGASAYRAHGDEFYLMGDLSGTDGAGVAEGLETVRNAVKAINLAVETGGAMTCTVSTGWLVSTDIKGPQTDRIIMAALELAVGEAKWKRNCNVRYSDALSRANVITLRSECVGCLTKFSLDLKRDANVPDKKLACPNCGGAVERPPAPAEAAAGSSVEV